MNVQPINLKHGSESPSNVSKILNPRKFETQDLTARAAPIWNYTVPNKVLSVFAFMFNIFYNTLETTCRNHFCLGEIDHYKQVSFFLHVSGRLLSN